ncbi:hypothetical protein BJX63DRAFT_415749 [Aspergillus granulosus]|uniref:Uncharacterized protein n=1 Tax=Aspergillus granulosus TaxID=176169 RepID=A0ABR4GSW6_9EURO
MASAPQGICASWHPLVKASAHTGLRYLADAWICLSKFASAHCVTRQEAAAHLVLGTLACDHEVLGKIALYFFLVCLHRLWVYMNAGTLHKQTATHPAEALLRTRLPTLRHDHEVLGNLNCASFLLGLSTLFFITIFLLLTAGHLRHSHYYNRMATIFLRCYAAARLAGLTSRNISTGWKASGFGLLMLQSR